MKIMIECECGNKISMPVQDSKYLQVTDNLEKKGFGLTDVKIRNGKPGECLLRCKCGRWISLGID